MRENSAYALVHSFSSSIQQQLHEERRTLVPSPRGRPPSHSESRGRDGRAGRSRAQKGRVVAVTMALATAAVVVGLRMQYHQPIRDTASNALRQTVSAVGSSSMAEAKGCSKWHTTGWHRGHFEHVLAPHEAPNGHQWTWQQCAARCASFGSCEYWTLELVAAQQCFLMSNKGTYLDDGGHVEGDKQRACLNSDTETAAATSTTTAQETIETTTTSKPTSTSTSRPKAQRTSKSTSKPTPAPTSVKDCGGCPCGLDCRKGKCCNNGYICTSTNKWWAECLLDKAHDDAAVLTKQSKNATSLETKTAHDSVPSTATKPQNNSDVLQATRCADYLSTTGCGWTTDNSCPGQSAGMVGRAKNDGSMGYTCCCKDQMWKAAHDGSKCADRLGDCCAHDDWGEPQLCKDGYKPVQDPKCQYTSSVLCPTMANGKGCFGCISNLWNGPALEEDHFPPNAGGTDAKEEVCTTHEDKALDAVTLHDAAITTKSYGACCDHCRVVNGCFGYMWIKATRQCWLKGRGGVLVADATVISGTVNGAESLDVLPTPLPTAKSADADEDSSEKCSSHIGQNNDGINVHPTAMKTATYGDCCAKCWSSSQCVGYTWVKLNKDCWLKSSLGSLRYDAAVISGSLPEAKPPLTTPPLTPTLLPSPPPTAAPTTSPTPTPAPTKAPTTLPTPRPTAALTIAPTASLTPMRTSALTLAPSTSPTPTSTLKSRSASTPLPTAAPTQAPTASPTAVLTASLPQKATCSTYHGHNNDGTNLHAEALKTESYTECCYQCWITSGCVGYTWVKLHSQCWLKSSVEKLRPDRFVVSGSPNMDQATTRFEVSTTTITSSSADATTTSAQTTSTFDVSTTVTNAPTSAAETTTTLGQNLTRLILDAREAILNASGANSSELKLASSVDTPSKKMRTRSTTRTTTAAPMLPSRIELAQQVNDLRKEVSMLKNQVTSNNTAATGLESASDDSGIKKPSTRISMLQ